MNSSQNSAAKSEISRVQVLCKISARPVSVNSRRFGNSPQSTAVNLVRLFPRLPGESHGREQAQSSSRDRTISKASVLHRRLSRHSDGWRPRSRKTGMRPFQRCFPGMRSASCSLSQMWRVLGCIQSAAEKASGPCFPSPKFPTQTEESGRRFLIPEQFAAHSFTNESRLV